MIFRWTPENNFAENVVPDKNARLAFYERSFHAIKSESAIERKINKALQESTVFRFVFLLVIAAGLFLFLFTFVKPDQTGVEL